MHKHIIILSCLAFAFTSEECQLGDKEHFSILLAISNMFF